MTCPNLRLGRGPGLARARRLVPARRRQWGRGLILACLFCLILVGPTSAQSTSDLLDCDDSEFSAAFDRLGTALLSGSTKPTATELEQFVSRAVTLLPEHRWRLEPVLDRLWLEGSPTARERLLQTYRDLSLRED